LKSIAIVTPVQPQYSETFIKKHIEKLPLKITVFNSKEKRGFFPMYKNYNEVLFSENIAINYVEYFFYKFLGVPLFFRERTLKKIINEENIKLILAEYGTTASVLLPFCKKNNIKLIVHFHGYDAYKKHTLKKFGKRYKAVFQYCSAIFSVSTDMTKQLINLGADQQKIIYNPYGVNLQKFSSESQNISKEENTFVFVGRFTQKKAPTLLIKSFNEVIKKVPTAKLVMIGNGELLNECQNLAKKLNLNNSIEFLGKVDFTELPAYLSKYEVYVQHSITAQNGDSEGTPNSILEAMACGLPIISTRHAGIKDAVIEEENGFLVDENDWEKMTFHMTNLIENKSLIKSISQKNRERIKVHYNEQRHLNVITNTITQHI